MAAETKIQTRCPTCCVKYRVPAATIGHQARCAKCKKTFRIAEYSPSHHHPTEEDILRWLNEDVEEHEFATGPRMPESRPAADSRIPANTTPPASSAPARSSAHAARRAG